MDNVGDSEHTLSSLHDERNTLPSVIVDVKDHRGESGALGSLGNRVIIEVTGLVTGGSVLAKQDLVLLDWGNGL